MAANDDSTLQPDSQDVDIMKASETTSANAVPNSEHLADSDNTTTVESPVNMEFLLDIPLEVTVELGRTKMLINDMLKLGQGSVIELTKIAGESLEILANQKPIARGEVVVVNEKYGVRLTEVISPMERIEGLR